MITSFIIHYSNHQMNTQLVSKKEQELISGESAGLPATIAAAGRRAGQRFWEFFTANIRNPNTRRAYHRACVDFFRWCESRKLQLEQIGPVHVAAYIEVIMKTHSKP